MRSHLIHRSNRQVEDIREISLEDIINKLTFEGYEGTVQNAES